MGRLGFSNIFRNVLNKQAHSVIFVISSTRTKAKTVAASWPFWPSFVSNFGKIVFIILQKGQINDMLALKLKASSSSPTHLTRDWLALHLEQPNLSSHLGKNKAKLSMRVDTHSLSLSLTHTYTHTHTVCLSLSLSHLIYMKNHAP